MSSFTFNAGSYGIQHRDIDYLSDTIEVIAMKSSYTPNKDDTFSVYAAGEISGVTGYTGGFGGSGRKALATKTITNDTTNDRTTYDADDPSAWTIGAGDTIGGFIIGKKGSASDATATPIFWLDVTDTPTNGAALTLQFPAAGIGFTQQ